MSNKIGNWNRKTFTVIYKLVCYTVGETEYCKIEIIYYTDKDVL